MIMYYGEKRIENPIRWAMVGGGKGSQILGKSGEITADTLSGDSDLYTGKNGCFR